MNIGEAVDCLKKGYSVRRTGWSKKSAFLLLVTGGEATLREGTPYADAVGVNKVVTIHSHIDLYTGEGAFRCGWVPTHADLLATDWETV